MARIFFGIRPPQNIVTQVANLSDTSEGVYWQKEQQLHITVCYVGEVSVRQLERIIGGFGTLNLKPFSASLEGISWFDGSEGIAHLWTRVNPEKIMQSLHSEVRDKLQAFDVKVEHQLYLPHLTIARLDSSCLDTICDYVQCNSAFHSSAFEIREVWLCESNPGRYSSGYQYLCRFPLHGQA